MVDVVEVIETHEVRTTAGARNTAGLGSRGRNGRANWRRRTPGCVRPTRAFTPYKMMLQEAVRGGL